MWLFRSGLFLLAYICINIYTGFRILTLIKYFLPSLKPLFLKPLLFWPLYILFCFSFVLLGFIRVDRLRPHRMLTMISLPFVFYFFLALLVLDGVRLVLQYSGRIPRSPLYPAAVTAIALILAVLAMVYGVFNARNIHTVHYEITLNKDGGFLPNKTGLRITLVSDLHLGATVGRKWIANIVDAVNSTEPDIICIAGDIFDNGIERVSGLEGVAEELRQLSAPLGVYACPGNHDVDRFSIGSVLREEGGTDRIHDFLKSANIIFLQDEVVLAADHFYLAGRKDARPIGLRQGRKSASELVSGLDSSKLLIFLDHQPVDYPNVEEAGADLIFSGHTHRGQFFPANVATKRIYKDAGAVHYGYWQGRLSQGVVTSGAGVWGPPIRIATRSEVAALDIRFSE